MSEQEIAAMEAVLAAAIRYATLTEDATLFLEKKTGKLSAREEDELVEDYAQASYALCAAVRYYRALNAKRIGRTA